MAADSKVTSRIRKLLALALRGSGPEADAAMSRAEAMCAEHGLDIDKIADIKGSTASVFEYAPGSRSHWLAELGWAIAKYAHVEVVRRHNATLAVVGEPQDFETWRALFERSRQEIDAEATRYVADLGPDYGRGEKRSEGDTFRKGAAAGFGQRLRLHAMQAQQSAQGQVTANDLSRARSDRAPDTESTALVLVSRALTVKAKKAEAFPKLGTHKSHVGGSRSAYGDGVRFGNGLGVHRGNLKGE